MKISVSGSEFRITPESSEETTSLVSFLFKVKTPPASSTDSKRKKPLHLKKCEHCEKSFKGRQGLAVHVWRKHRSLATGFVETGTS